MTVYAGYDVLDQTENSRNDQRPFKFNRPFTLLDNQTGLRASKAHGPMPSVEMPFTWIARGRTECAALKSFLLARMGRGIPFWVPTHQRDLTAAFDLLNGGVNITINNVAYSNQLFPSSGARRHLAIYPTPGGTPIYRKVTGAGADPGGATETLTVDSAFPQLYSKNTVCISFLMLCRMTNDHNKFDWLALDTIQANWSFTELPWEAPT